MIDVFCRIVVVVLYGQVGATCGLCIIAVPLAYSDNGLAFVV